MKYYSGVNLLFKIYKDATLFFSQDKVLLIANVIPTMDHINALLSDAPVKPLSQSVKHILKFACKSINKYYLKTDLSNVYHIAMGEFLVTFTHFIPYFSASSTVKIQILSTVSLGSGLD